MRMQSVLLHGALVVGVSLGAFSIGAGIVSDVYQATEDPWVRTSVEYQDHYGPYLDRVVRPRVIAKLSAAREPIIFTSTDLPPEQPTQIFRKYQRKPENPNKCTYVSDTVQGPVTVGYACKFSW